MTLLRWYRGIQRRRASLELMLIGRLNRATVGCGSVWGCMRWVLVVVLRRWRRAIIVFSNRLLCALLMNRIDRRARGLSNWCRWTVGGTTVGVHNRAQIHRASFYSRETTTATSARQRLWLITRDRGLRHAEAEGGALERVGGMFDTWTKEKFSDRKELGRILPHWGSFGFRLPFIKSRGVAKCRGDQL